MKKFLAICSLLFLAACGGGSSATPPDKSPVEANGRCSDAYIRSNNAVGFAFETYKHDPGEASFAILDDACNQFQRQYKRGIECKATELGTGQDRNFKSNDIHDLCDQVDVASSER